MQSGSIPIRAVKLIRGYGIAPQREVDVLPKPHRKSVTDPSRRSNAAIALLARCHTSRPALRRRSDGWLDRSAHRCAFVTDRYLAVVLDLRLVGSSI
jgi:hypothetical protein